MTGAKSKGQSSLSKGKYTFMSQAAARALPSTEVTEMRKAPLALAQGTRRRSSSVVPDLLKRTKTSLLERAPMSPWRASSGERKPERMPRETRVWEILWATKPDLPTPEKKTVAPAEDWRRRVRVKDRVWERSRCWKKKLRWLCWDLKRLRRVVSSMHEEEEDWVAVVVLGLDRECGLMKSVEKGGREPMISALLPQTQREKREKEICRY